jgi:hypothetical protein
MADLTGDTLAARRYRQLLESNVPIVSAEKLATAIKEPPAAAGDAVAGPPDFIGIGSMKSGTTWWHALIMRHPQVHSLSWRKELHFFDLLIGSPCGPEQVQEYHRYFSRPPGMVCGEWTPRYLSDFWAPRAIKMAAPDAKLLLLVRDPIDRFISGVTHQLTNEAPPKTSTIDLWPSHFARGLYHQHISRYLELFPRQQLLVLQYERCVANPLGEIERTFRFLGLDMPDTLTADVLREQRNTTEPGIKVRLPPHILTSLLDNYREDVDKLAREFPEIDRNLWTHFRHEVPYGA